MGHIRLGTIPKTQKWWDVIASLTGGRDDSANQIGLDLDDIALIADKSLEAVQTGLEKAIDDPGLRYTFYLLTQVVLTSRKPDWFDRLHPLGIHLDESSTILDLTMEVQCAVEDYLTLRGQHTDVGEMAQRAVGETLLSLGGPRSQTLFGSGAEEVRLSLRELSTKAGFARVGQRFFGRFMTRFLNFYLSRVTATYINASALTSLGGITRFNDLLQTHCDQSARIVHDFSGEWYSKYQFTEGINPDNTGRFMAVALKKLREEMKRQRTGS